MSKDKLFEVSAKLEECAYTIRNMDFGDTKKDSHRTHVLSSIERAENELDEFIAQYEE